MCSYDDKMCHINDNCKLYFGISSVNDNVWIVILISVFHLDELKNINYSYAKYTQFTVMTEKLYSLPFKFKKQKPYRNQNKI